MIKSFGYVMLLINDMTKSVEFYKKLTNLQPEFTSPRWSQFNVNGTLIALHNANSWSDESDPLKIFGLGQKGVSFALYIENLDEYLTKMPEDIKASIKYGPRMTGIGNVIYVEDPDGYYVQICQPLKSQA